MRDLLLLFEGKLVVISSNKKTKFRQAPQSGAVPLVKGLEVFVVHA